ncbi:MAG: phosphonopyruvate decarboxylase [Rhodospirillaceae bacterium]|jgi:sulfopyruvate decarboxylase alpha subunit|nr:phosphonopyruvate decarboxylase [Rhodospirillaceae bacterium]MBT3490734.1 phosphonopyruvate decarboxylase [Rhodospirillaceae bacterium]MBT3783037.1 phosphonopyruvate decarboxylase [Rhodospirillaceae bacterium]MBT3976338.1 phosphonopyruvate decarboxylase [Rhodospirillaceae bacterium]MBT4169897.1 phosphonopyruvate decarboxylase [Rhodospirillaceae bacterium]
MESNMSDTWPEEIYGLLRENGIEQIGYVPDAGHDHLIKRAIADPDVHAVALTTEEEGVGLLAGAHLGGSRGVLLMQSSGVGNCINLLSLPRAGRFPFLTLVTMRGDFGEGNPWQMPMGQSTQPVLEACDVTCFCLDDPGEVSRTISAAITTAFVSELPVAVLLGQRLIGAKVFEKR